MPRPFSPRQVLEQAILFPVSLGEKETVQLPRVLPAICRCSFDLQTARRPRSTAITTIPRFSSRRAELACSRQAITISGEHSTISSSLAIPACNYTLSSYCSGCSHDSNEHTRNEVVAPNRFRLTCELVLLRARICLANTRV